MELQSQPQPPKKRSYIAQSSGSTEYAQKVGEGQQFRGPPAAVAPTRLGVRGGGGGEIVEVQGGHIVRSTGRKDRHSKVCTAKGPRDRRVRLSAHTAIQFYDVQDRLGYDRPSKAVDWLIKKAKAAIDELAELPAWKPTTSAVTVAATSQPLPGEEMDDDNDNQNQSPTQTQTQGPMDAVPLVGVAVGGAIHSIPLANAQIGQNRDNNSSFLPPSLDSDSIADTIKSFFPLGASADTTGQPPSAVQLHSYPHPPDLLSRTSSHQSQDLRLSLHSFTDPILVQHRHQQQPSVMSFSGTQQLGFETAAPTSPVWSSDHQHQQQQQHSHTTFPDISRFQRIPSWNISAATGTGDGGDSGNRGTFLFAPSSTAPLQQQPILQPLFAQNQGQYFSQRGPLQSSNTPPIRAWINPTTISTDHQHHHQQIPQQQQSININPHAISELGFSPGGFLGYHIPARIRGQEEEDRDEGAILSKPSSASSESRH